MYWSQEILLAELQLQIFVDMENTRDKEVALTSQRVPNDLLT